MSMLSLFRSPLAGNGDLEPKDVTVGPRIGDYYVILSGLKPHDEIVTSANFLLDSESQLQAAAGSFTPPVPGAGNGAQPSANANAVTVDFTTDPNPPHRGANTFKVKLTGADGKPLEGADVSIHFFMAAMPAMGMAAMNASVHLNAAGAGMYAGPGTLPTGGTWQATIIVTKTGQTIATKQVHMNAEGGM